jgi:hypothetical protein
VQATPNESYLGIGSKQLGAIVQIVDAREPDGTLCTGTLVGAEWVVTAGHCLAVESAEVVTRSDSSGALRRRVVEAVRHPAVDVALLRLDAAVALHAAALSPVAVAGDGDLDLARGPVVEIAGYGLTETGSSGELRFLAERVVAFDPTSLTVGGFGITGACLGDSGGPLLARAPDGRLVVAGVLSTGSASCRGEDTYVRLDAVQPWLEETTGGLPASVSTDCGTITETGRCLYGSALWCSGTRLVAEACGGEKVCGWDVVELGFRCVSPLRDPCDGVDSVGSCAGGDALFCRDGTLERRACTCAQTCAIDGATGAPFCLGP